MFEDRFKEDIDRELSTVPVGSKGLAQKIYDFIIGLPFFKQRARLEMEKERIILRLETMRDPDTLWRMEQTHRYPEVRIAASQRIEDLRKRGEFPDIGPTERMLKYLVGAKSLTGDDVVSSTLAFIEGLKNPEQLREIVAGAGNIPAPIKNVIQTVGQALVGVFRGMIEYDGPATPEKATEAGYRFIGTTVALTTTAQLVSSLGEFVTGGRFRKLGDNIQNIYWNMGLGFLTWAVLSPTISETIADPMKEYYQELYRTKRFTDSQALDLWVLGEITEADLLDRLRKNGWKDEDIVKLRRLAYTPLTRSDIFRLSDLGLLSKDEVAVRLRTLGYSKDDIALLIKENELTKIEDTRGVFIGTLRKAFRNNTIGESEFRGHLEELNFSPEAIELEVSQIKLEQEQSFKELSASQLKAAFMDNLIDDTQALAALKQLNYSPDAAALLVRQWSVEKQPKPARLPRTVWERAYKEGLIDAATLERQYVSFGYSPEEIQVAFRVLDSTRATAERPLSVEKLQDAWAQELITDEQFIQRVMALRYSEQDAQILLRLAEAKTTPGQRHITLGFMQNAVLQGVLSLKEFEEKAREQGYPSDEIAIVVASLQAQLGELVGGDTEDEKPPAAPPTTLARQPLLTNLERAYISGLIGQREFILKVVELNYSEDDALLFLDIAKQKKQESYKPLNKSEILDAFLHGLFTWDDAWERLTALGYSMADADLLLSLALTKAEKRVERGGTRT